MSDILIKNGTIIDGTGKEGYTGHVYIEDDKIKQVIASDSPDGKTLIDKGALNVFNADGLIVSPGFIDCHSHFDWLLPLPHHQDFLYPMIEQGITTVVTGNCGFSPVPVTKDTKDFISEYAKFLQESPLSFEWEGMGDFFSYLKSSDGLLFNNAQLVGHGTAQMTTVGNYTDLPTADQMSKIVSLTNDAYDQGVFGLSYGLMYPPGIFSPQEDLKTLANVTAERGRLLAVHIKALSNYSGSYPIIPFFGRPHNLKALDEIIAIALETKVKLQISHLIFAGKKSWKTADKAIRLIEKARNKGLEVMWDIYPHFCGNSYLTVFLPAWFIENLEPNLEDPGAIKRLRLELRLARFLVGLELEQIYIMEARYPEGEKYNGLNLLEISQMEKLDLIDTLLMIIRKSKGQALQLTYGYSGDDENEWLIEKLMSHECCLFETDTLLISEGSPNPASYGAFPRILGRFVREKQTLGLSEAISKMTGKTAKWMGIENRGEIKSGNFADIVLFNADTIADNTSLKDTAKKPTGIEKVFVNGEIIVMDGCYLKDKKSGKVLTWTS